MKRFLFQVVILLSFCFLLSCKKEVELTNGNIVELSIALRGEITDVFYAPMTKTESDYCLMYNLYIYNSESDSFSIYASGYYKDLDSILVQVATGSTYKICASYFPFSFVGSNFWNSYPTENVTDYGKSNSFLCTGAVEDRGEVINRHPVGERYYCEKTFSILQGNESITLEMKRCAAKLAIKSDNLLVGSIICKIDFPDHVNLSRASNINIEITAQNRSADVAFCLVDATLCWNNEAYSESYMADFYYLVGDTEKKIASKTLVFWRNTITNVHISANNLGENTSSLIPIFESEYNEGETVSVEYES